MKQYAENGRVGICHPLNNDEIYIRTFSGGYPYLNGGVLVRSSSVAPIYSYGKNYSKDGDKFAMFVWTTENDSSKIEELFESLLDDIPKEKISQVSSEGSFVYLT